MWTILIIVVAVVVRVLVVIAVVISTPTASRRKVVPEEVGIILMTAFLTALSVAAVGVRRTPILTARTEEEPEALPNEFVFLISFIDPVTRRIDWIIRCEDTKMLNKNADQFESRQEAAYRLPCTALL